jgi:hypothetical protein
MCISKGTLQCQAKCYLSFSLRSFQFAIHLHMHSSSLLDFTTQSKHMQTQLNRFHWSCNHRQFGRPKTTSKEREEENFGADHMTTLRRKSREMKRVDTSLLYRFASSLSWIVHYILRTKKEICCSVLVVLAVKTSQLLFRVLKYKVAILPG